MSLNQQRIGDVHNKRSASVLKAQSANSVFDCSSYVPDNSPIIPVNKEFFNINDIRKITNDSINDYTAAVWSPNGEYIVFVVPTSDVHNLTNGDPGVSDVSAQPIAMSKNNLLLYTVKDSSWELMAKDGTRPVWAKDGRSIYYLAGQDLLQFELDTRTERRVGLSSPDTNTCLLISRPLPDGTLFAPREPHASMEIQGGGVASSVQLSVTENDSITVSPTGDQFIVIYGATTQRDQVTPATAEVHRADGTVTPLLRNCNDSALEMVWSSDGSQIAYPVRAERPEIRVYDVASAQTSILVRLDLFDVLSGLSWSSDGRYLAFAQGDGRSEPRSLWVVATDGTFRQRIGDGFLPNWSPDGTHLLYAQPGSLRLLDWFVLDIKAQGGN